MSSIPFQGNLTALITPMHPDGRIDEVAFVSLIEWQIESGCDGLIINGTTGESATTSLEEKGRLLGLAKSTIRGRVPLIAGTGTSDTRSSMDLCQQAQTIGVDACLVVTPYYNKPTQAGLLSHYGHLASHCTVPLILYNVPGRTACDLQAQTVAHLAQTYPNIVGIKEATGQLSRLQTLRALIQRPDFVFLSGDDETALAFMELGGHGVISVTSNVAPNLMRDWIQALQSGKSMEAQRLFNRLMPLHQALFVESNPIPCKWVLHTLGKIEQGIRLPLTWLSDLSVPILQDAMTCL